MSRKYPKGRLGPDDEGELEMRLAADHARKRVRIDFGKPVHWLGLGADDARALAAKLRTLADLIDPQATFLGGPTDG